MSCEEGEASSSDSVDYGDVVDGHTMQNSLNLHHNGHYMGSHIIPRGGDRQPFLEIVEHPQSRGFRFRYACEGQSHGGLRGENNTRNQRTFPTVKIHNYRGPAKITVSLVAGEGEPRPHAHELIGKNCKNGICTIQISGDDMTVPFQNLGIRHVTKKNVQAILTERIVEAMRMDKFYHFDHLSNRNKNITEADRQLAKQQAEEQARTMQLNIVRLLFTAYLADTQGEFTQRLQAVVSNAIFDSKSPGTAALRIYRMDKCGGCCYGQEEVFLLCDKVQKDDISVRFFECDEDGHDRWDAYGVFGPADVHRQYAIVFRTPPYRDCNIGQPIIVKVQLKRVSDGETSEPKDFVYYPKQHDEDEVHKKRKKPLPFANNSNPQGYFPDTPAYNPITQPSFNIPSNFGYSGMAHLPQVGVTMDMQPFAPPSYMTFQEQKARTRVEIDGEEGDDTGSSSGSSSDSDSDDSGSDSESEDSGSSAQDGDVDDVDGMTDADLAARIGNLQLEVTNPKLSKKQSKKCKKLTALDGSLAMRMSEHRYRALHDYAKTGNIQCLLKGQHNLIAIVDSQGDTPLHHSVIHCQPSVIDNLLQALEPAKDKVELINQKNKLKQTPLHVAAITQQAYAVRALICAGADPTLTDRKGNTPLHCAIQAGDMATIRALMAGRPSHPLEMNIFNFEGYAPLHLAVLHGHMDVVQELLEHRADINLPEGRSGRTALHLAVESSNDSMATYMLLEHKADVNVRAFDGNTPLHIAVGRNLLALANFLVTMGADIHAENYQVEEREGQAEGKTEQKTDEEGDSAKQGMTPFDLAKSNENMRRVLSGEGCVSGLQNEVIPEAIENIDSGAEASKEQGVGDLKRLSMATRQKLAELLDPVQAGSDWIALATWLSLSSEIEEIRSDSSPTLSLLERLESQSGSVEQLEETFRQMDHSGALRILREAFNIQGGSTGAQVSSKASLSPSMVDAESGLGSMASMDY